jgi:S-adenosylmethionine-diacylgycerolhomoserine-N-methlytransferase
MQPQPQISAQMPLQAAKMTHYYRFQSLIYDWTRWSFLFGRKRVIDLFPFPSNHSIRILEVGCGTGSNLAYLARQYPNAKILGVDPSADMLKIAARKTRHKSSNVLLIKCLYDSDFKLPSDEAADKIDIILFSYCLTMVNPNWENLLLQAKKDLAPGGYIALVDFHDTAFKKFSRWMAYNHVRMEGQLLPFLEQHFSSVKQEVYTAYFGLWRYVLYIGRCRTE